MTDPVITRAFDRARELQSELDTLPSASPEFIEEVQTELMQLWPYYGEPVVATGRIRSNVYDYEEESYDSWRSTHIMTMLREDGEPERCDYFVADQMFVSHGFVIEKADEPIEIGGMTVGSHYLIKLLLSRRAALRIAEDQDDAAIETDPEATPVEHTFDMPCIANIDEVLLEFPTDSSEYAKLRSFEYFPEIADRLGALDDDESLTVADKLLALADIEVKLPEWIAKKDGADELDALAHYAYDVSELEYESLPFAMIIKPNTPLFNSEEAEEAGIIDVLPEAGILVSINSLRLATRIEVTQLGENHYEAQPLPGSYEFRITVNIRQRDSTDDSPEFDIRLRDITDLENVRHAYYAEEDVTEGTDAQIATPSDDSEND